MDEKAYQIKASEKMLELLKKEENGEGDKDILNLKFMYWQIQPYSRAWRNGYKHSLKKAIKALGGDIKDL